LDYRAADSLPESFQSETPIEARIRKISGRVCSKLHIPWPHSEGKNASLKQVGLAMLPRVGAKSLGKSFRAFCITRGVAGRLRAAGKISVSTGRERSKVLCQNIQYVCLVVSRRRTASGSLTVPT